MSIFDSIKSELEFSYSRSSGAGGQNVNKVNTKVSLYWSIEESQSIDHRIRTRFLRKYKRHIFKGKVVIHSQRFRTQYLNKDDCLEKLKQMLILASKEPKKRKKTKVPKGAIEKRIKNKKLKAVKKRLRSEKHH